jgi:hypothetical protein
MRIAHLIMAHKNPLQLSRLINRLKSANADIYIHLDAKIDIKPFKQQIKLTTGVNFINNRNNCNWGGFSFVQCVFNSMQEILQFTRGYSFINLLSAQDYPIKDVDALNEYLRTNINNNFISFDTDDNSEWLQKASGRYQRYHLTDFNIPGKYLMQSIINKIMPIKKLPHHLKVFGSSKSCWWTITGACAAHITQSFFADNELRKFLKYCWGMDEIIIATLIMNSPYKNTVINNNLRYIDWSEGNPNPKILLKNDLNEIINSGMFFARKFDTEIDPEVLDALDSVL